MKKLLQKAIDSGYRLVVSYGCETDYVGTNVNKAFDALTACDEMHLTVQKLDENYGWKAIGWALIVTDPSPGICDCSGWVDQHC